MIIISGTLPNRIKIIYVNSQAYLIIKDCESECFRIDSVVRKGRITGKRNSTELEFKNLFYLKNKLNFQEFFIIYMLAG